MSAENINGNFGHELKILREGLGFSQAAFAKAINEGEDPPLLQHQSAISRIEDGKQLPPMDHRFYAKLATFEGVGDIGVKRLLLRGMLGQKAPRVLMGPMPGVTIYMHVDSAYTDSEVDLLRALTQVAVEDFVKSREKPRM